MAQRELDGRELVSPAALYERVHDATGDLLPRCDALTNLDWLHDALWELREPLTLTIHHAASAREDLGQWFDKCVDVFQRRPPAAPPVELLLIDDQLSRAEMPVASGVASLSAVGAKRRHYAYAMKSVTVLSDATNFNVVHSEGRRYPGLVLQGDRLRAWHQLVHRGDSDSIEWLAEEIAESLAEYERVCALHGLSMPG